jgi:1-acyl-sn-glycerol-3-phosphate acyltransferase
MIPISTPCRLLCVRDFWPIPKYTTKTCRLTPCVFSLTCLFETANTVHNKRPLMYWAKASLFKNPIAAKILYTSGVIPVDRGAKDNHKLFAGTFKALSDGDCVALFPEGTSYTMPRIVQVKDGASWATLEYMKWVQEGRASKGAREAIVVPVGITYTNKSKYRSSVVIEFVCFPYLLAFPNTPSVQVWEADSHGRVP